MTIDLSLGALEALIGISIVVIATIIALAIVRHKPCLSHQGAVSLVATDLGNAWFPNRNRAELLSSSWLADIERVVRSDFTMPVKQRHAMIRPSFSSPLAAETHWQRVTAAVELSLERAGNIAEHQAAAVRQLHAAEYALHTLLDELSVVMTPVISSPLATRKIVYSVTVDMPTALAA